MTETETIEMINVNQKDKVFFDNLMVNLAFLGYEIRNPVIETGL